MAIAATMPDYHPCWVWDSRGGKVDDSTDFRCQDRATKARERTC
jgi:hypothetical protein